MSNTILSDDQSAVDIASEDVPCNGFAPCECEWDDERQRWDASRRCGTCSARTVEFKRLVAECEPAVNLYGKRLDQLPPLTLADELGEVDQAVADGVCSRRWASQARRNIIERHRIEPTPPAHDDEEPASEPASCERAIETTGCDPPAIEPAVAKLAALLADDDLDDALRQLGEPVLRASYERSRSEASQLASTDLDNDGLACLVAEVERIVLDTVLRRRDRAERRLSRLVAEVAGHDGDAPHGYLLLCADAGEALATVEGVTIRRRAAQRAEAAEAERRERQRAERAARRGHPRPPRVEPMPMGLVRPHVEVDPGPTEAQREDLVIAWALVGEAPDDYDAWLLLRQAAVAAGDDDVATLAKARLRELRQGVA